VCLFFDENSRIELNKAYGDLGENQRYQNQTKLKGIRV